MANEKQKLVVSDSTYNRARKKTENGKSRSEMYEKSRENTGGLGDFYSSVLQGMGTVGQGIDSFNTGLGNIIDKGFDNTIGALVNNVTNGAIDPRQWLSGEGVGTGLDLAEDLGLFAASASPLAPIALPLLGVKSFSQNADTMNEGLTGMDLETGEQLSDEQKALKNLAGYGNFALMMLPAGAGKLGSRAFKSGFNRLTGKTADNLLAENGVAGKTAKQFNEAATKEIEKNLETELGEIGANADARLINKIDDALSGGSSPVNWSTGEVAATKLSHEEMVEAARRKVAKEMFGDAGIPETMDKAVAARFKKNVDKEVAHAYGELNKGNITGTLFEDTDYSRIADAIKAPEGGFKYSAAARDEQINKGRESFYDTIQNVFGKESERVASAETKAASTRVAEAEKAAKEIESLAKEQAEIKVELERISKSGTPEDADVINKYLDELNLWTQNEKEWANYDKLVANRKVGEDFPKKPDTARYSAPKIGELKSVLDAKQTAGELKNANITSKVEKLQERLQKISEEASSAPVSSEYSEALRNAQDWALGYRDETLGDFDSFTRKLEQLRVLDNPEFAELWAKQEGALNAAREAEQGITDTFAEYATRARDLGYNGNYDEAGEEVFRKLAAQDARNAASAENARLMEEARAKAQSEIGALNEGFVTRTAREEEINNISEGLRTLADAATNGRFRTKAFGTRFDEAEELTGNGFRRFLPGQRDKILANEREITDAVDQAKRIGELLSEGDEGLMQLTTSDVEFIDSLMSLGSQSKEARYLLDVIYRGKSGLANLEEAGMKELRDAYKEARKSFGSALGNSRAGKRVSRRQTRDADRALDRYQRRTGPLGTAMGLPADWAAMAGQGYLNAAAEYGPENTNQMIAQNPGLFASMALAGLVGRPLMRNMPGMLGRRQIGPMGFAPQASNIPYRMMAASALGQNLSNQQVVDDGKAGDALANIIGSMPQYERGYKKKSEKDNNKK